ncbi:leucine-rich repeat domain-containing protein [Segatella copri]|uniref:leucine-rich repeat domain-containing protein n=1 Tax=Segatella copri TaxID=165179 RepID=UPI0025E9548D|nr:leucine-rich repeat protein [Segatella copri]
MKENKKAILEILKKNSKKDGKFENLVLNLALQKIDSDSFEYDGNAVYTNDKKRLVYCMSQETSFTIPEGVEIIGEMAFRGKKALKNVIIANSVKEIEHDAFYDCDELDNVYVPAGVKVVRSYAFAECDNLKKVTFAGTPEKVGRHTFDDCDQLHDIIVPVGSSKFFRKELHFIEGDTDYLVLEDPKKKAEIAGKKAETSEKKNKKEVAEKKVETPEKKADKKADSEKKTDKKADSENKSKKEPAKVK